MDYLTTDGRRQGDPDDGVVATVEWLFGLGATKSPDGLPVFGLDNYQALECRVGSEEWRIVNPHVNIVKGDLDAPFRIVENQRLATIPAAKTRGRFRVLAQLLGIVTEEG